MDEYNYRLIQEYYEKKISEEGLKDLSDWVEADQENLTAFRETMHVLEASAKYPASSADRDKVWGSISSQVSRNNQTKWLAYAAAILILLTLSMLLGESLLNRDQKKVKYTIISNSNGKQSRIMLPDSSIVYLQAGSSIRYNKAFNDPKERIISLQGEAFFEVIHDENRPFIVHSGAVNTLVLGTSFNVKAFKADNNVKVTVRSGKVGVSITEKGKEKFLQYLVPDQQLSVNPESGNYSFSHLDAASESSWKENKITFNNASLQEIGRSLERWYNIKVVFSDPKNTACQYTAKFDFIPLHQLMDIMAQLTDCTYSIQNNHLIINNKKCKQEDPMYH
ncbi:FecR family protein [Arcticibacter eurypsychrophilus]|uniref:FecR family protein n=1 Tax=Arcticibacter eurypsychrophilus TaxID=1434752 RepID=UPI00084D68E5|nr:FecR family protein [Arcticibacter eurypsychrophilus]